MSYAYTEGYRPFNPEQDKSEKNIYGKVRDLLHFDEVDKMILGVGDCRTGTTAWLAAAVRAGFPGYYQAGKGGMRCILKNIQEGNNPNKRWVPDNIYFGQHGRTVVAKETIGPQNPTECSFNPVKAYSYSNYDKKGLDPSQLHIVFFLRNPVSTFLSWEKVFSKEVSKKSHVKPLDLGTLKSNFTLAARTEMDIYKQLVEENRSFTVFAQELLQAPPGVDQAVHSAQVLQTIFDRAGAPISDNQAMFAVSNWREQGPDWLKDRIFFPNEPDYNYEGGIYPTLNSEGYGYIHRDTSLRALNAFDLSYFESADLIDFYNDHLHESAEHLGIKEFEHLYLG